MSKKDFKNRKGLQLRRLRKKLKRRPNKKENNKKKRRNKSSLIQLNTMKTDPIWSMSSKSPLKRIPTHTNLTLALLFLSLLLNMIQPVKKANSLRRLFLWPVGSPTLGLKEKTLSFMIWRVMEKDFKSCVTSTTIKAFKPLLTFTQSSEEVISLVLLVNQAEQTEVNYQLPPDKFFCFLLAFTCFQKPMSALKINKLDTERDIWTWSWTRKLDKHLSWDQKSFLSLEGIWTT